MPTREQFKNQRQALENKQLLINYFMEKKKNNKRNKYIVNC